MRISYGKSLLALATAVSLAAVGCEKGGGDSKGDEATAEATSKEASAEANKTAESGEEGATASSEKCEWPEPDGPIKWRFEATGAVEATVEGAHITHNADCSDPNIKSETVSLWLTENTKIATAASMTDESHDCGSGFTGETETQFSYVTIGDHWYAPLPYKPKDTFKMNLEINSKERVKGTFEGRLSDRSPISKRCKTKMSPEEDVMEEPVIVKGEFDSKGL